MEVHQLAYFESVSRHLHFTRAAEELNVAQPSVSQQIRKLETELGAPLFHRMKRHVALTEAGETFLPHARAVLQRLEEARIEVQELSGLRKGSLAVGAPPSVGTHLLPRALAAFSQRHPGITLAFREAGSRTLLKLLEEGELDLAVVIQPIRHPALETTPLLEEELLLAVPRHHPLATIPGQSESAAAPGPRDLATMSDPSNHAPAPPPNHSAAAPGPMYLAAAPGQPNLSAAPAPGGLSTLPDPSGLAADPESSSLGTPGSPPGPDGISHLGTPGSTGTPRSGGNSLARLPDAHGAASPAGFSRRVPLTQLRDEPFVLLREGAYDLREQTLAACRRAGFEPRVALDGGEMDSMLRFVAAGIGVAILPEMVLADLDLHDGPVAVRRTRPKLSRSLVVARRRDRYFSAAAREFATLLEDAAAIRRDE